MAERVPPVSKAAQTVPSAYWQELLHVWQRVSATAPISEHFFALGPLTFRLRFAGNLLKARLLPSLAHLRTDRRQADFTVHLWDDAELASLLPLPCSLMISESRQNQLHLCSNDRFQAFYETWIQVISAVDLQDRSALYGAFDSTRMPRYESTTPLRPVLNRWLNQHGLQIAHASAVATARGAALLLGKGGSGKSSTALLALNSDLDYISDDLCVIGNKPKPHVYSLYNSAKLREENLHRFPHLAPRMQAYEECGEKKATLFLQESFPQKIRLESPVRVLLLPRVTGKKDSSLARTTWNKALQALVPWSVIQAPGSDKKSVELMFRFVSHLPAYDLLLGTNLDQIPPLISETIALHAN